MYIETERLVMRNFNYEDLKGALEYLSDSDVMKYIEAPFTYKESKDFIKKYGISSNPLIYALIDKNKGNIIGHIIFHKFDYEDVYEIGWIIDKRCWGKNYCFEISKEIFNYAFNEMRINKVVAEVVTDNKKSIALIKKLGMISDEPLNQDNSELRTFSVTRY
ncbi:GNAT family N-acetyltransferase [Clostridium sp. B9]|uniref:GNAT family N-acetyltransferase n=1 Tax=Clostridium sp. B9 TaxID=3423224 RepID=UPI003D2EAC1E